MNDFINVTKCETSKDEHEKKEKCLKRHKNKSIHGIQRVKE
jgi:hypothetical protein